MSRRNQIIALSALVLCFACSTPVLAETAHEHAEEGGALWQLRWFYLNFFVYCLALYLLLRKKTRAGWAARTKNIQQAVVKSAADLAKAQAELDQAGNRLQTLASEIERIKKNIESETKAEATQIVEEAKKKAERMIFQAKELAINESRATEKTIQQELAELVITRATARLDHELTMDNDKPRREAALTGVTTLNNSR